MWEVEVLNTITPTMFPWWKKYPVPKPKPTHEAQREHVMECELCSYSTRRIRRGILKKGLNTYH
jgi:hypothetical protein